MSRRTSILPLPGSPAAVLLASLALTLVGGCSSSADSSPATTDDAGSTQGAGDDDGGATGDDAGGGTTHDSCAAPPRASKCKTDSAWVRGVAHFDPSKLTPGSKPVLRVILRHSFALLDGEDAIGGRLHGWTSAIISDPSKGEAPFDIDMCGLGTSMWSEENGTFHLVLILDENGNNDLDTATSNADATTKSTPDANELAKLTDVDISCHAPSNCLDVNMDCTGPSCLKITPITSCTKKTPGCDSDSTFCK